MPKYQPVNLYIYLSISPTRSLFLHLSIYPSIRLSICPSIHPFTWGYHLYQCASLHEEETVVTPGGSKRTGGEPTGGANGGRDGEFAKFRDSRALLSIRQVCANKNLLRRMDNVADKSTKFNKSTSLRVLFNCIFLRSFDNLTNCLRFPRFFSTDRTYNAYFFFSFLSLSLSLSANSH